MCSGLVMMLLLDIVLIHRTGACQVVAFLQAQVQRLDHTKKPPVTAALFAG